MVQTGESSGLRWPKNTQTDTLSCKPTFTIKICQEKFLAK